MNSILLFAMVLLGSLVTGLTGLGGGTLVLAGLLLIYPPELAIPLHSFTQLAANTLRVGMFHKEINWRVVAAYAILMIPAAWAGAMLFEVFNPNWLKILVGVVIIVSILPFKFKPTGEPKLSTFVVLGGVSGFLGVFVGAVGPMITPFFNRLVLSRQGNLSTKSAGQALLQVSKIVAFTGAAGIDFMHLKNHVLILVLGTLVGVGISIPLSRKISDDKFNHMLNFLLGLIALKVIFEGASALIKT